MAEKDNVNDAKLVSCEVCGGENAKYTCPKCEVRTCCLSCVHIHKRELECDGIRDKTKFVPMKNFTDLDLLSDYRLLEQVGRSVDSFQRDPSKKYTRQTSLPVHLYKLKTAVKQRGTTLEFLPQNFSRHKENTTFYQWKSNELFWRVEWIFPQAENLKHVDSRVPETEKLATTLERILNPLSIEGENTSNIEEINLQVLRMEKLQFYRAAGLGSLKLLLKAEKVKNCDCKFHLLDFTATLRENLEKKCIIEFPVIYVVLRDHSDMYETLDTDDEEDVLHIHNPRHSLKRHHTNDEKNQIKNDGVPKNFFFDDYSSGSDTEIMESNNRTKNEIAKASRFDFTSLVNS